MRRIGINVVPPHGIRAIHSKSPIVQIHISKCRDLLSYSYCGKGWHYYSAFLRQYMLDPKISYDDSILKLYHQRFQPRSLAEALGVQNEIRGNAFHSGWPPLPWMNIEFLLRKNHQHFGPFSNTYSFLEYQRCQRVFDQIKSNGYQPEKYPDGYIRGYFLKGVSNYRFLVTAGQHRIAAMAVLGYEKFLVKLQQRYPRVIDIRESAGWPQVRNGVYSKEQADQIFKIYFTRDGKENAESLNLYENIFKKKHKG